MVIANGNKLCVVQTQSRGKRIQWDGQPEDKGVIMSVDWNNVNNHIVSGGEDCCYRVFDAFGLPLYISSPHEHVITSVSWRPNGQSFAVGTFNLLRVCDQTGWTDCRVRHEAGSVVKCRWSPDGTQIAGACGGGSIVKGEIVDRTLEYQGVQCTLIEPKKIAVQEIGGEEIMEELDFPRDRVVDFALGHGHLVVCTATQCLIYDSPNYNTPQIFDIRNPVNLIVLSQKSFAISDTVSGLRLYNYEGRHVSSPRFAALRPDSLTPDSVSLSADTVAILDRTDGKTIRCFDAQTGRPTAGGGSDIKHSAEIVKLSLSQYGGTPMERRLFFIDSNRDLYLCPILPLPGVSKSFAVQKLATQVDTASWNDTSDMLTAVADNRLTTWYNPTSVYVDKELADRGKICEDATEFGKMPKIQTFFGNTITVRRADGALLTATVPPYCTTLYDLVSQSRWDAAVRLCRFVKSNELWSTLATMAIYHQDLDSAVIALGAIQEVDKLQYIKYIQGIASEEGRNAEMMLYKRCPEEAERCVCCVVLCCVCVCGGGGGGGWGGGGGGGGGVGGGGASEGRGDPGVGRGSGVG